MNEIRSVEPWVPLLIRWYQANKRDLPWRGSKDPYEVWVSEIMLQQTRVEAVIGYYMRFMEQFPTIKALAAAPEDQVLKAWEGLGYYSRARNLKKAAEVMMEQWEGQFPSTYEEIRSLPGIGEYTAGAICSIARGQAYPAVDGNVLRVIARLYNIEEDVMTSAGKRHITSITERNIPEGYAGEYTQSMMDLGAAICIPKYPRCGECPIKSECAAYEKGVAESLPIKKKKQPPQRVERFILIVHRGDTVLMTRRGKQGVLAGLWEFPGIDMEDADTVEGRWQQTFGLSIQKPKPVLTAEHVFSHIHWYMHVYETTVSEDSEPLAKGLHYQWMTVSELADAMIPVAFRKIMQYLQNL